MPAGVTSSGCRNCIRFYFRFVQPNLDLLELGLLDKLWEIVNAQMRAFIGQYAF